VQKRRRLANYQAEPLLTGEMASLLRGKAKGKRPRVERVGKDQEMEAQKTRGESRLDSGIHTRTLPGEKREGGKTPMKLLEKKGNGLLMPWGITHKILNKNERKEVRQVKKRKSPSNPQTEGVRNSFTRDLEKKAVRKRGTTTQKGMWGRKGSRTTGKFRFTNRRRKNGYKTSGGAKERPGKKNSEEKGVALKAFSVVP